jgi:putative SOS response-associated peptidase YedK
VAVVVNDGENALQYFKWGLIPPFARDPSIGSRMINARAETLAEKPSFRAAYGRRRCLVIADGFFEWRQDPGGKTKTPMLIRMKSGRPFAFAGLWETWRPRGSRKEPVRSCTIITTAPNPLLEKIHNRMPVILKPESYQVWLDPAEKSPEELAHLLVPFPESEMTARPVSTLVNNPRNDVPECVRPVEDA